MGIWHNDYEGGLPFLWACRHLSGAARAYIPLSIIRLPYSNHLSHVVVFILSGGIKDKGWILFLLSIKIHYIFISDMERSTIVIQWLMLWLSLLVRVIKCYGVQVIKAWLSFISYLRACSFAELRLDSPPRCPDSPGTWYNYWGCGPGLVPLALYRWAGMPIFLDPGISLDCRLTPPQA